MRDARLQHCTVPAAVIAGVILAIALYIVGIAVPVRAQTVGDAFPGYECPAAGTEVVGSDGRHIRYGGAAADATMMCLVEGVGPRLLGLPPAIGEWSRVSPRNLEELFRTGRHYFLVGDRPVADQCRNRPETGPWPAPEVVQRIGKLQHLSIPAMGLVVMIFRYEEVKLTCGFRTEFENTEIWIDTATRAPVRVSIHRSLAPPVLPAVAPRTERIEWHAETIVRVP